MDTYYLIQKKTMERKGRTALVNVYHNYIIFMGAPWVSESISEKEAAIYTESQLAVAKRYYIKKNIPVEERKIIKLSKHSKDE